MKHACTSFAQLMSSPIDASSCNKNLPNRAGVERLGAADFLLPPPLLSPKMPPDFSPVLVRWPPFTPILVVAVGFLPSRHLPRPPKPRLPTRPCRISTPTLREKTRCYVQLPSLQLDLIALRRQLLACAIRSERRLAWTRPIPADLSTLRVSWLSSEYTLLETGFCRAS
jgi:hypothetical protein